MRSTLVGVLFTVKQTVTVILLQIVMVNPVILWTNREWQSRTHWVPVQKSPKLKMLRPLCEQTDKKIFLCKAQRRLKEVCVVKPQPQEQPQKSHKHDILQKHLQTDWSIDLCLDIPMNVFASLWIFMCQGRRTMLLAALSTLAEFYGKLTRAIKIKN